MTVYCHLVILHTRLVASAPARLCADFVEDQSGQDMIEYALIAAFIGLGTVTGIHGLAAQIANYLGIVDGRFDNSLAGHM
ncbi:MAG TPA: hypothetical protein VG714_02850 [Acidobacteriaceae bacterium]|nr:hypothetical protein [Acidobacteriaceae bacterium]